MIKRYSGRANTILSETCEDANTARPFDFKLWQEAEFLREHASRLRVPFDPTWKGLWALSLSLAREVDRRRLRKEKRPTGQKQRGRPPSSRSGVQAQRLAAEFRYLMASGDFETEAGAIGELQKHLYNNVPLSTLKRRVAEAKKFDK
jgi:hypothetical protein